MKVLATVKCRTRGGSYCPVSGSSTLGAAPPTGGMATYTSPWTPEKGDVGSSTGDR